MNEETGQIIQESTDKTGKIYRDEIARKIQMHTDDENWVSITKNEFEELRWIEPEARPFALQTIRQGKQTRAERPLVGWTTVAKSPEEIQAANRRDNNRRKNKQARKARKRNRGK